MGLPLDRATSDRIGDDPQAVRLLGEALLSRHPELVPQARTRGFTGCGQRPPSQKRAGVGRRRLRGTEADENGHATIPDFFLRPRFVWPSCWGTGDDVAKGMLLWSAHVPDHVVPDGFGRNPRFGDRLEQARGRNRGVGTTVRDPDAWPPHVAADEHQARLRGEDASVALTAGGGCVLGMALSPTARAGDLTAAYGRCRDAAGAGSAGSTPEPGNSDGGKAPQAAGRTVFPKGVLIWCFGHGFWKIRDRCRKAFERQGPIGEGSRAAKAPAFRAAREWVRPGCAARGGSGPIPEAWETLWSRTEE